MKIAFISTMRIYPWGGSEELWYNTAKTALSASCKVYISVYKHKTIPLELNSVIKMGASVSFKFLESKSLFKKILYHLLPKNSGQYKDIEKFQPDFICISQGGTFEIIKDKKLIRLLENYKERYAIICHGNKEGIVLNEQNRNTAIELFKNSAFIGFVAEWAHKLCEKQLLYKINHFKIFINPVKNQTYLPIEFPADEELVKMAMVGSLTIEWKGHDIIIELLSQENWRNRNWVLSIFGSGHDISYIKGLIKFYNLDDRIFLKGYNENIKEIWSSHHIHLMPSRIETAPISLVEAMLSGRPTISTLVGGINEWIEDKRTGFVANCPNVVEYGRAMEHAWINRKHWKTIGLKAHKIATEKIKKYQNQDLFFSILKHCNKLWQ